MICKRRFMCYNKNQNECFCKEPFEIENYEKAIADESQVWECHHRAEICYSRQELIEKGDYYNVPPCNLIFLTKEEHRALHNVINPPHGYKRTFSKEHNKNLSKAKKGKPCFNNQTNAFRCTGMHWYNNGVSEKLAFECPEGFTSGRLQSSH